MEKKKTFIIKYKIIISIIVVAIVVGIMLTVAYCLIIKDKLIENQINNVNTINMLLPLEENDEYGNFAEDQTWGTGGTSVIVWEK